MHRLLLIALPLLATPVSAMQPAIALAPVPTMNIENSFYSAIGGSPGWVLMIGDDRIAMRTITPGAEGQPPGYRDYRFPRTLPRTVDEVRIWQSSAADQTITVEARRLPCRRSERYAFEDSVRVTLNGHVFQGCGGRALREGERR